MQEINKTVLFKQTAFHLMQGSCILLTCGISKNYVESPGSSGLFWQWLSLPIPDWPEHSIYVMPFLLNLLLLTVLLKGIYLLCNLTPRLYQTMVLMFILCVSNFAFYINFAFRTTFIMNGFLPVEKGIEPQYGLIIYNLSDTGLF